MAFKKGKSGNPRGRGADKEWRDAVRLAVHELREVKGDDGKSEKIKALRLLARALVDAGLVGDVTALKEIGDRLDGKPTQAIEHAGEGGGPIELADLRGLTKDERSALRGIAEKLAAESAPEV